MFKNLKIRTKLVAILAGPLAVIIVLSGMGAVARRSSASKARHAEELIRLAQADTNIANEMQQENLLTVAYLASGRKAYAKELKAQQARSDAALSAAKPQLVKLLAHAPPELQAATQLAVDTLKRMPYVRQDYTWDQAAGVLANIGDSFLSLNFRISTAVEDPAATAELRTVYALSQYKAATARQAALMVGAATVGKFPDQLTFDSFEIAVNQQHDQEAVFQAAASAEAKTLFRNAQGSANPKIDAARAVLLKTNGRRITGLNAKALLTASSGSITKLNGLEQSFLQRGAGRAASLRAQAERSVTLFLAAASAAILAAAAIALLASRSITGPVHRLTEAARILSQEQMPKLVGALRNPAEEDVSYLVGSLTPIDVDSEDEIGQLATAFNDVQKVAGEVAVEQAALLRKGIGEMFVNLARRNQSLLDRQIEFIDELEAREADPDQLENLFKLDHLATRMRRNAESLLVLAGAEPARKRGRPVPLGDVVRAALAEVEDFARIELLSFDDIMVANNAASDVAHLLSELMENAAHFSPPETKVEVVGHRVADGYLISISDHGIGMAADQISAANDLLARPPLVGLDMSRSLGFIVSGRLAARYGIAVRLTASPSGGVTAVVSLPPALVTDSGGELLGPAPGAFGAAPGAARRVAAASSGQGEAPPADRGPHLAHDVSHGSDVPNPSSLLPPLEFTPYGVPDEGPVHLDDAVPVGQAFDDGLAALMDEGAADPLSDPAPPDDHGPVRGSLDGPPPDLSSFGITGPRPPSGSPSRRPPAGKATGPEPLPGATSTPPAPPAPPGGSEAADADAQSRPFFVPEPLEPAPPRLFGGPSHAPRPAQRPPTPAAPPPVQHRPAEPATPAPMPSGCHAAGTPAEIPGADVRPAEVLASGLTKRVPRRAGATRAVPGSDNPEEARGVGATKRSPDEVRSMLSSYRSGQQRGRTDDPDNAGQTDERDAT